MALVGFRGRLDSSVAADRLVGCHPNQESEDLLALADIGVHQELVPVGRSSGMRSACHEGRRRDPVLPRAPAPSQIAVLGVVQRSSGRPLEVIYDKLGYPALVNIDVSFNTADEET